MFHTDLQVVKDSRGPGNSEHVHQPEQTAYKVTYILPLQTFKPKTRHNDFTPINPFSLSKIKKGSQKQG